MSANSFLQHAMGYADREWSIIPIGANKVTVLPKWKQYQSKRPDESALRSMFAMEGITGLAVVCGRVSGDLVCRDFDKAGAYGAWAKKHPEIAATLPTVKTGRGHHVYFRSPECTKIKKLGDGELRGGGYCLLPTSKHPSGAIYEWIVTPPPGDFPEVDPFKIGLAVRDTEYTEVVNSVPSVDSVLSVPSVSQAVESRIRQAILATLPKIEGERGDCVFRFARALKGVPEAADLSAGECRKFVRTWHRAALPVIGTKPFEATWDKFVHDWGVAKFALGYSLNEVLNRAKPLPLPPEAGLYDCPKTHLLMNLCRQLQLDHGDRPFFLSCRDAGRLVDLPYKTANMRLRVFVVDGLLKVARAGTEYKATRYRYLGNLDVEAAPMECSQPQRKDSCDAA